jgi:DMSO/TMAO reductase YedYZ molybdopterin-dependent catalytic subunit
MNGKPFAIDNGAPVRGLVPDLYFWKSAKWLTGIELSAIDKPGFWERYGYHNDADYWQEQRYSF